MKWFMSYALVTRRGPFVGKLAFGQYVFPVEGRPHPIQLVQAWNESDEHLAASVLLSFQQVPDDCPDCDEETPVVETRR